ncbi:sugar phosphate isomerase/epimerase family protein [Phenylobacterium sp.]|jgi:sugar phosphate isomerase/epimerase|uniref:sugar phosphate isomerase/epimerase family protein n=1 Tax=Phenylobacterium sp. TaxID=1871053 RepID=UPI002F3EAE0E
MDGLEIGLCWGALQNASLPQLIEAAGRHGFPTITLRPAAFLAALEEGLTEKALRRRLADAGVRATMIDAISRGMPGMPPPEALDPALHPDAETCLRAAEALGAPVVNVAHFAGRPVPLQQMAEAVGGICRRAGARGLQVVLEFIPDTGLPDLAFAQAVARACGEANCTVMLDVWHLARSGGTIGDIRRLPPDAIGGLQLSDRTPPPPGTPYVPMSGRDLPGEGRLPLADIVRAALANRPGLTAEVEVFNDELRSLPVDAAAARIAAAVRAWRAAC